MKFAKIILNQRVGTENNLLTYAIPTNLSLKIGNLVKIPLRKKITTGLVWELTSQEPDFKTSEILGLADNERLVSEKNIELIKWISNYYFCPLPKVIKLFIPKRIFAAKPITLKKTKEKSEEKSNKKAPTKVLSEDQKKALTAIQNSSDKTFLLHGITGSGKTEIYAQLAQKKIKNGSQVLILVPEISLTPQTINYFEEALEIKATVINSKISEGEKFRAWKEIYENKAKLVIGSRSAIFSPFKNLELIIVDEEHELTYKQDNAPRYSVHKIIEKMQDLDSELTVIFGSATPSIETSEKLKERTIFLNNRIGQASLPVIEIVDLREEFKKQNYSIFSESLKEELNNILAQKQQAILFLNRRGSASSIVCRDCGYTASCPHCELPLTYHSSTLKSPSLICHHCGKIENPPNICPNCKGANIRFLGIGTQKIEAELLKEFPGIKILRADKDTTSRKNSFKKIYDSFKKGGADILIGTQMIAKGLHLPNVNLVGVILADIGLNIPDFRTAERNFQLMTQVAGRSGRLQQNGKVIIQTYNPSNTALICAQNHSYNQFAKYERTQRKILANPPFSQLAKITIENKSLQNCHKEILKLEEKLKTLTEIFVNKEQIEINSYPAYIARLRGKYRHIILIKDKSNENLLHNLLEKLPKEDIINPNIKIDIDPVNIT